MRTAQIERDKCYFWHGQRSEGLKLWVGKVVWLGVYVTSRKLYVFVQWYRHASDVELKQKHSDAQELYLSDSKEAVHPRELLAEVHVHDKKEVCMRTPVRTWRAHSPSLHTQVALTWGCVGMQDCPAGDLHSFWWNRKLRTEAGVIYEDAEASEDVRKAFKPDEHTEFRYRQYAGTKVHKDGEPPQHSQAPSQRKEPDNHRDKGKGKGKTAGASTSASASTGTSASTSTSASACASSSKSSRKNKGSGKSKSKGKGKSQEAVLTADSDEGKGKSKSKGKARSASAERLSKKHAAAHTSKQSMLEELAEAADGSSMVEDLEEGVQESLWEVVPALSSPAQ